MKSNQTSPINKTMQNRQRLLWMILFTTTILALGVYSVLIRLSELESGAKFSATSLFLTIELIKFTFSVVTYNSQCSGKQGEDDIELQAKTGTTSVLSLVQNSVWYSVPGLMYFINNNLSVYCTKFMDATSYTVLTNFKIISTGILYYLIMGRVLSKQKWFSLVLLFCGGVIYVYGTVEEEKDSQSTTHESNEMFISIFGNYCIYALVLYKRTKINVFFFFSFMWLKGVLLVFIYVTLSGLSGVITEFIYKKSLNESIHLQNLYLYFYGFCFNLLGFLLEKDTGIEFSLDSMFANYNIYTWLLVISQAYYGLSISFIMKYSNNITKLFAVSCSLLVNVLMCVWLFDLNVNIYFYWTFIIIISALYLYNKPEK